MRRSISGKQMVGRFPLSFVDAVKSPAELNRFLGNSLSVGDDVFAESGT